MQISNRISFLLLSIYALISHVSTEQLPSISYTGLSSDIPTFIVDSQCQKHSFLIPLQLISIPLTFNPPSDLQYRIFRLEKLWGGRFLYQIDYSPVLKGKSPGTQDLTRSDIIHIRFPCSIQSGIYKIRLFSKSSGKKISSARFFQVLRQKPLDLDPKYDIVQNIWTKDNVLLFELSRPLVMFEGLKLVFKSSDGKLSSFSAKVSPEWQKSLSVKPRKVSLFAVTLPEIFRESPVYAEVYLKKGLKSILVYTTNFIDNENDNIKALPAIIQEAAGRSPSHPPPVFTPKRWGAHGSVNDSPKSIKNAELFWSNFK